MQDYSVSGAFGEVKYFKSASPSNCFQSIDHILSVGYHKVNELYQIKRPQGSAVGLLLMTISGSGKVLIKGKKYTLTAGTVAVLPAGVPHFYACAKTCEWEFYWVHFYGKNADLSITDITQNGNYVFELGINAIEFLMRELIENNKERIERELVESECLRKIFSVLLTKTLCNYHSDKNLIDEIIAFIENQESAEFSLKELVDKYHYSKEYIIRLFTDVMKTSPYHYWLIHKLKRSCLDLKENDLSICEVANKYGYKSVGSYSKQFKKVFKISPLEYRKMHIL